jgi:3-hydroxyisobutyrate dehydrogenase
VQALIGSGFTDIDFAALIEQEARLSGLELVSEDVPVDDGLEALAPAERVAAPAGQGR